MGSRAGARGATGRSVEEAEGGEAGQTVSGAGVLRLEYVRSFDDPVVAERVAEFVVRVDDAEWPPPDGSIPSITTASAP